MVRHRNPKKHPWEAIVPGRETISRQREPKSLGRDGELGRGQRAGRTVELETKNEERR